MDQILNQFNSIPAVTRYWSGAIFLSSIVTSLGLCLPIQFKFSAERGLGSEPWLCLTTFCYFGPMSFDLLLSLWFHVKLARYFEDSFLQPLSGLSTRRVSKLSEAQREVLIKRIDKNKTVDYLYFVFLVCTSIIAVVSLGSRTRMFYFFYLGPLLQDILLFIWCRDNPDVQFNIMGLINLTTASLPMYYTVKDVIMSREFQFDLYEIYVGLNKGDFSILALKFQRLVLQSYFWRAVICLGLSHFWYFFGILLPRYVYYDTDPDRRSVQNDIDGRRQAQRIGWSNKRYNIVRLVSKSILLPPWYWYAIEQLPPQPEPIPVQNVDDAIYNVEEVEVEVEAEAEIDSEIEDI